MIRHTLNLPIPQRGWHRARRVGRWSKTIVVIGAISFLCVGTPELLAQTHSPATPVHAVDSLLASLLPPRLRTAVLAASRELSLRRAEITAAEARRDASGFASPGLLVSEVDDARNGRLDRGSVRVEISRAFLSSARTQGERAVGDMEVQAARVSLGATERRVLAEATRALYTAVGWRAIVRRLAAQDSLLASAEASVRARLSVGEARYVDVLRLRTERLRVNGDRVAAESEIEVAAVTLVGLIGGDSAAAGIAAASFDSLDRGEGLGALLTVAARLPEAPSVESLVATAADVRLADARIALTAAQRQLLLAEQRPSFAGSLGLQRIGQDSNSPPGLGPVLSVGMTLPFTAGRANRASLEAADRRTAVALAERSAASVAVRAALGVARARYEAARRRATSYDAALLRAAREERESALAAYRITDISLLDLLDFERALTRVEIERARASIDALASLAELLSGAPSSAMMSPSTAGSGADRGRDDR